MKTINCFIILSLILIPSNAMAQKYSGTVSVRGEKFHKNNNTLYMEMILDVRSIKVSSADALVIIPELFNGEESIQLPYVTINGHKRHKIYLREYALGAYNTQGEEYTVIESGTEPLLITYAYALPYQEWMKEAGLRLKQQSCGCPGKEKNLPDKLVNNLIFSDKTTVNNTVTTPPPVSPPATPETTVVAQTVTPVVAQTVTPVLAAPVEKEQATPVEHTLMLNFMEPVKEEIKERYESGEAYLNFQSGKWEIIYGYMDNADKLDQVQNFFRQAQEDGNIVVDGIEITGYASPEGNYEHNMMLSQNRAMAFASWVKERFRFPYNIYMVQWRGEDWEKLRNMVQESYMTDKYQVLDIINRYSIFQNREARIMTLSGGQTYRYMMTNMFPLLRRVQYRIDYTVRPFNAQESRQILKSKPQQLSMFEMFSAANTYGRSSFEYNRTLKKAVEIFPDDPVANNNAAAVALQEGRLGEAKFLLDRTPDSPSKQNNLGVYYMLTDDIKSAQDAFYKALKGGIEDARHNIEILHLQIQADKKREKQLNTKKVPYMVK